MIIISDEVYTVVIVIICLNCWTIKQQEGEKSQSQLVQEV